MALSGIGLVALAAPATAAPLVEVSPVDNATGFPFWFGDGGDPQVGLDPVRLELCLDDEQDPLCPVVGDRPSPGQPLSVPENFPDESFWWSADALIQTPAGIRARLVLGQEAAFGGVGDVAVGQQVAFSRLRIRIDDLPPGASYHVTTPYGERDVVADDGGRVFETEDQGCLSPPCGFEAGLNGEVGPFLRWDSGAPEGYVGDPAVEHTVVGSPTGDNFFRVDGPDIGGPGVDVIETDLFTVQGRIAQAARDRRPARRPLRRRHAGPDHAVVPRRVRGRVHHRRIGPAHQRVGDVVHLDDRRACRDGHAARRGRCDDPEVRRTSRGPDQRRSTPRSTPCARTCRSSPRPRSRGRS